MLDGNFLKKSSKTYTLHDGRCIGTIEVGDNEGQALFFFHGWPGSRVSALSLHETGQRHKVKVIGIDRPGIGLSSPKPNRTILDWPKDVQEVADQLGISRFSVAGISGGGPFALACAHELHERINSVGIIAGMAPFELGVEGMRKPNQQLFAMASKANWLVRFFFWMGIARNINNVDKLQSTIQKMMADLPDVDREVLATPGLDRRFALELQQAFLQGARSPAKEGSLFTKPWGFSLKNLPNIPTHIWHGELDVNVPIQMSKKIVQEAPHIKAHFFPGEGHISLFANHMEDILKILMSY